MFSVQRSAGENEGEDGGGAEGDDARDSARARARDALAGAGPEWDRERERRDALAALHVRLDRAVWRAHRLRARSRTRDPQRLLRDTTRYVSIL